MTKTLSKLSPIELSKYFCDAVLRLTYARDEERAPTSTQKKLAVKVVAALDEMRLRGEDGQNLAIELVRHPSPPIQLHAVLFVKEFNTSLAKDVLTELSKRSDLTGFSAMQGLKSLE